MVMLTERLYDASLANPSRTRSIIRKLDVVPAVIDANGAILRVQQYSPESLTFTLEKAWQ